MNEKDKAIMLCCLEYIKTAIQHEDLEMLRGYAEQFQDLVIKATEKLMM